MKSALILLAGLVSLSIAIAAQGECVFPHAPDSIPDGKTASQADMVATMTTFKQYNADVEAYLVCLDQETAEKIKDVVATGSIMQIKTLQQKKKTAATEERESKVATFNEQVRAFKSRKS